MSKVIVINGSARSDSNTERLVKHLLSEDIECINLVDMQVNHYRYDGDYPSNDDFQRIVDLMLEGNLIIFATPVYWYTMSGHLKIFLDRITDLVTIHKEKGRALKSKKLGLIAQSSSDRAPEHFADPIRLTAEYMDMEYVGEVFWDSRGALDDGLRNVVNKW